MFSENKTLRPTCHAATIKVGRSTFCGHAAMLPRSENFEIATFNYIATYLARTRLVYKISSATYSLKKNLTKI